MTRCRSCGAPILWKRTQGGKTIPLDLDPTPDGNLVVRGGVAVVVASPDQGEALYMPHFATCPNATVHRRPR